MFGLIHILYVQRYVLYSLPKVTSLKSDDITLLDVAHITWHRSVCITEPIGASDSNMCFIRALRESSPLSICPKTNGSFWVWSLRMNTNTASGRQRTPHLDVSAGLTQGPRSLWFLQRPLSGMWSTYCYDTGSVFKMFMVNWDLITHTQMQHIKLTLQLLYLHYIAISIIPTPYTR